MAHERYIVPNTAIAALSVATSKAFDALIVAGESRQASTEAERDRLLATGLQALHCHLDTIYEVLLAVVTEQPEERKAWKLAS